MLRYVWCFAPRHKYSWGKINATQTTDRRITHSRAGLSQETPEKPKTQKEIGKRNEKGKEKLKKGSEMRKTETRSLRTVETVRYERPGRRMESNCYAGLLTSEPTRLDALNASPHSVGDAISMPALLCMLPFTAALSEAVGSCRQPLTKCLDRSKPPTHSQLSLFS